MLKKLLLPQKKSPENQPQPEASPNLIFPIITSVAKMRDSYSTVARVCLLMTVFIQSVFVVLLFWNMYLNARIDQFQQRVDLYEKQLLPQSKVLGEISALIANIDNYKKLKASIKTFGGISEFLVTNVPDNVKLLKFEAQPQKAVILVQTATPINFAFLINNYFKNENISSVSILTAQLSLATGEFTLDMEVSFK